jgi:hypothetical protein
MDVDTVVVPPPQVLSAASVVIISASAPRVRARKTRGPYRRYTAHRIEQLFDYMIEQGKTEKDAARRFVLYLGCTGCFSTLGPSG